MSEWISVKDKLPPMGLHVLGWNHRGIVEVYLDSHPRIGEGCPSWFSDFECMVFDTEYMPWWMPLPAPPEEV